MTKLPISAFMRNYYKEQGVAFTDFEKSTIIWNANLPKTEILSALLELANTTADEALRVQIQERLGTEAEFQRSFAENDGRYFFVFVPDDEDEWNSRYFAALDAAIAYGKEHSKETFKVLKEPLSDRLDDCGEDNSSEKVYICGQAWYTKDGTLLDCECYTEEISARISHPNPSCFEDAYIRLQNPFELGDIVRIAGGRRPAIVLVSQEQWHRNLERHANSADKSLLSYENTSLTVEFLADDGEMYHGHPYLLSLEKIEQWDDELEWQLLQSASELIKRGGGLDDFLYYYHQNLDRHKKNEN